MFIQKVTVRVMLIIILFLLGMTHGVTTHSYASNDPNIVLLYEKGRSVEILERYSKKHWTNVNEIFQLNYFCRAVYEQNSKYLNSFDFDTLSPYVKQYIESYLLLLAGDIEKAQEAFLAISQLGNESYSVFGIVGCLELCLFIEDYNLMNRYLNEYGAKLKHQLPSYHAYYTATCQYNRGNMDDFYLISRHYDISAEDANVDMIVFYARALLMDGNIDDALQIIENAIKENGEYDSLILTKYEFLIKIYGDDIAFSYLDNVLKVNPEKWFVKLYWLMHKIDADYKIDSQKWINKLTAFLYSRQQDIQTMLLGCDILTDYRSYSESLRLLSLFFSNINGRSFFMRSHLLDAKYFLLNRKKDKSKNSIYLAKQMAPNDSSVVSFLFELSIYENNFNDALSLIEKSLRSDPFDMNVLYRKAELLYKMKDWDELKRVSEKILRQKRYLGKQYKIIVMDYKKIASKAGQTNGDI